MFGKNEYRKCMTNLNDYVPGSSFNFICHSVNGSQFSGDFKTKYVSTSFIDENIHEVYKSMYGFIFSPDNIVWANYEDSYIVNNSNSNEDISRNTVLPILMHPKLVMKKCIEQKQKNQVDKISKPVYNEIVLDGFNPIGIFCLSNGSKTLCNSYGGALKLKKAFPNLPIIDIDLTLYNNNSYDMFLKQELIYRLNSMFDRDVMNCDFILKKYDLFYEQFIKLKKQKNLTEEDIKNLYDDYTNKFI